MKRYVRETHQLLEGLGFVRHEDPFGRHDRVTYSHHYEPETRIQVYVGATENACKAIQARAQQIAGLGTSGAALPKTVGERKSAQREKRSRGRARQNREAIARQQRAEKAEREYQHKRAISQADAHRREIEDLMRPGRGH